MRRTVMISSTARDLPDHREQVRLGCQRLGFGPDRMMENLTARDATAVDVSLEMVAKADLYICILAWRYGFQPPGSAISITEMEYDRAVELKKPRLVFFIHEDHPVTGRDVEKGAGASKLEALKQRIGTERVAAFFRSPDDLRAHVVEALATLLKEMEGATEADLTARAAEKMHRRSAIPAPPAPYVAHPYTLLQTRALIGRRRQLTLLTDWVADPAAEVHRARILAIVAIGGMGKSALAWKWFRDIAPEEMSPLAGRLWWSFYESDASFETFLIRALAYVSGDEEDAVRKLPWPDREQRLLQCLNDQPHLLVLDGLERILQAYHRMDASRLADDNLDEQTANRVAGAHGLPASAAQSFIGRHRLRQTTDPRAGAFLRKLTHVSQSRILITTRLYPTELQAPNGRPLPGCFAAFLPGLDENDAVGLWRALGASGPRADLLPIFRSVESHPLLIQALASEVANYRPAPGDFARWRADHPQFDPATLPLVQSRTHILDHAFRGLDPALRQALETIVAFRMPASYETLSALLIGPDKPCADAGDLDRVLSDLEDRGLIGWDREANRYDAHPIVRGVVWSLTAKKDQQAVLSALEAHFEPMATPDWKRVESLADLAPAMERYNTLIGLGRLEDAFTLFWDRLSDATLWRLAVHRERIEMLERLFPGGTDDLPALQGDRQRSYTLNTLALSYMGSGRPGRASRLYRHAAAIDKAADDQRDLSIGLSNFGDCLLMCGALREAEAVLRSGLVLDRSRSDPYLEAIKLRSLGGMETRLGHPDRSLAALERSRKLFRERGAVQSEGVVAAFLSERAVTLAAFDEARTHADEARTLADHMRHESDYLYSALVQGRAALGLSDHGCADERLHLALTRARAASLVEFELPALIALARLALARGRPDEARAHLDDVWDAAELGPYPAEQADALNVLAEIEREAGNRDAAVEAATRAYKAAWCDGPPYAYHWGLQAAKAHLAALGAPEPDLPPFDDSKYEPLPGVKIVPKDEAEA